MKKSILLTTLMILALFLISACGKVAKETGSDSGQSQSPGNPPPSNPTMGWHSVGTDNVFILATGTDYVPVAMNTSGNVFMLFNNNSEQSTIYEITNNVLSVVGTQNFGAFWNNAYIACGNTYPSVIFDYMGTTKVWRYDGVSWGNIYSDFSSQAFAIANDSLYPIFSRIFGLMEVPYVYHYNGSSWNTISSTGLPVAMNGEKTKPLL